LVISKVSDQLRIDLMEILAGNAAEQAAYEQQAGIGPGMDFRFAQASDQLNSVIVRLNRLEATVQEHQSAGSVSFGELRMWLSRQLRELARNIETLRIQAPRQMWHAMHQREQRRLGAFFGRERQQNGRQDQENVPPAAGGRVGNGGGRVGNAGAGGAGLRPPVNNMPFCRAELQKNVRNLHELWLEYEVGSGGRKPAKFFTPQERGLKTNKDRFCRRKVFWDCVRKHVDAGISAAVAIERIQDAYGHRLGVTALCLAMKKDLPQGHPNLRV
jgi:hypothetical protein